MVSFVQDIQPKFCKHFIFIFYFVTCWILRWEIVSPPPNPQSGGPLLVRCPQLFIQYIRNYCSYLKTVFSTRNLRTHHDVVTWDPLKWIFYSIDFVIIIFTISKMFQIKTVHFNEINMFYSSLVFPLR